MRIPIISKYRERKLLKEYQEKLYSNIAARINAEYATKEKGASSITVVPIALQLAPSQITLLKELIRLSISLDVTTDEQKEQSNDLLHSFVSGLVSKELDKMIKSWVFNLPRNYDELYILAQKIDKILNLNDKE